MLKYQTSHYCQQKRVYMLYDICKREILAPYVINHHIKAGQTITRDRTLTRLAPKSIKC